MAFEFTDNEEQQKTFSISLVVVAAMSIAGIFFTALLSEDLANTDEAEPVPISLSESDITNKSAIQQAVTAYFNVHSLGVEDIQEGLTIAYNGKAGSATHGILAATGDVNENGEAVFIDTYYFGPDFLNSKSSMIAIKP